MTLDLDSLLRRALRLRRTLTFAAAVAAACAMLVSGAGRDLDNGLRSVRAALRNQPASGELVVIEIDAKSIAAIDRWPWPRSLHGKVVDRLKTVGARLIGFDVDFSAESTPAEDQAFAKALERGGGSVILPTFRQQAGSGSTEFVENLPIEPLRAHAFLAAVNVHPDADGWVRSYPLGVTTAGVPRPSIAAMLAERAADASGGFRVDYAIDPTTIPRYSFVDVIDGRVPAAALAGKRVLIGATAIELGDRYAVPRWGVIPGVVIQALAAETLLRHGVPIELGPLPMLLLALGACLVLTREWNVRMRAALVGGAAGLILALPLATKEALGASFELAPALAALAAAIACTSAFAILSAFERRRIEDVETGLPNARALERTAAQLPGLLVAVGRIERFAEISAALGPAGTATFVQRVAERLALASDGAAIYRLEEAAMGWVADHGEEIRVEERFAALANILRAPVPVAGRAIDVTMSFGLAEGRGDDVRRAASAAIAAALRAAETGKRWERAEAKAQADSDWMLSLMGELDEAMQTGALWVAYQPKLDIASGRVFGAEALVRWLHPERGAISPDTFVPLIEAHDRAAEMTAFVLERALSDAAAWARAGTPLGVAVNLSATLVGRSDLAPQVRDALRRHGVPAEMLTIEVTESAVIASPDAAIAHLEELRALGVRLSIDDYGTGQSTLTYLKRFPASELKIDKSFVQNIADNHSDRILVRSTIDLAHALDMKVVSEGVEDAACLNLLRELGCDIAQGWHVGKPMRADELLAVAGGLREAA